MQARASLAPLAGLFFISLATAACSSAAGTTGSDLYGGSAAGASGGDGSSGSSAGGKAGSSTTGAGGKAGATGGSSGSGAAGKAGSGAGGSSSGAGGSGSSPPPGGLFGGGGSMSGGTAGSAGSGASGNAPGAGGSSSGGTGCGFSSQSASCNSCLQSTCCAEAQACAGNPDCSGLNDCLVQNSCQDSTCANACASQFPGGVSDFNAFAGCMSPACDAACNGGSGGGTGGSGGSSSGGSGCGFSAQDPACNSCLQGSCCAEAQACAGNPDCSGLNDCLVQNSCQDSTCANACASQFPGGVSDFNAFAGCINTSCSSACGGGSGGSGGSTGGTGGTGGSTGGSSAVTWTEIYNTMFGPSGSSSCVTNGACHTSLYHGFKCGKSKDTCYTGMVNAGLVNPGSSASSSVIADPSQSPLCGSLGGNMPQNGTCVSNAQVTKIKSWLASGAPNN